MSTSFSPSASEAAHTPGAVINIDMESDQTEALGAVFSEADEARKLGAKGIVFGQVFETHAKVCFIGEPWAGEIADVISRRAKAMREARS